MSPLLIALTVLLIALAVLLGGAYHFSNVVLYPKRWGIQESYDCEAQAGRIVPAVYEALPKEEIRLRSPYGYELYGLFIPCEGSRKTVIFCHGVTFTLYGSVKYMEFFRARGFNALIYDHRNHGRSGGTNTSYGFYEKEDLRAWVDWVFGRCGADSIVGIHGESMGAAVALQHAAIDPRPAFYIADCPYADIEEEFRYRLKVELHLPAFPLVPLASRITHRRAGYTFQDAAPIRTIDRVTTPILFIHGQEDRYIPPDASIRLHGRKPGIKKLYLVPHARHAQSCWIDPEGYDRQVGEFLNDLGLTGL